MSSLNIRINVDLVYKPIYKPLSNQMLAIAIAQSDLNEKIWDFLKGDVDGKEIENIISMIIPHYKMEVENKILGNKNLEGEKTTLEILGDGNKRIKIGVTV